MSGEYTFICHPGCTTCKKARAWLDENGIAYVVRDIREENPSAEELRKVSRLSGRASRKLFNTSGQLYRGMGLKEKLETMSEDEQFALLATDGMLVKRPLLVGENVALAGFKADDWAKTLKK